MKKSFHGGVFSSLHQLWALVDHSLCRNDSLYTPYKRVKACTPHLPGSLHSLTIRWANLHELFIDFFWAFECQTCHRPYQLTGPEMVKSEPVERGLNANLRTFSSTSAFIFNLNLCASASAALIRGNRTNCAQFSHKLDWLVSKLERLESSSGIKPL